MNQPAPRGPPPTAAYLRDLATRSRFHTRADHFHDIAAQLDRANPKLRHLKGLSAYIRDHHAPRDID